MMGLLRWGIGRRLGLAFALLLLCMGALAGLGSWGAWHLGDALRSVYEDRAVPVQQLARIDELMQRNRVLVMDMLLQPGAANVERGTREVQSNTQELDRLWQAFSAARHSDQEQALVNTVGQLRQAYLQGALLPASRAMADNRYDEASDLYLTLIPAQAQRLQQPMERLMRLQLELAAREFERANRVRQQVTTWVPMGALLALGLGVGLAWVITRSITRPLAQAVRLADAVAQGDLSRAAVVQGQDEAAQLLRALEAMRQGLLGLVTDMRDSSAAVSAGAAEVATGGGHLSLRTEQQAANLEETSASMLEITANVAHNADTAQRASALAAQTSAAAQDSGQVVGQVVATMRGISDSSRQIADITSVIDGIAFQTNILALNAAVEAARAGELGRGFAVVAAEVRQLAQRSATAAREIKDLIGGSVERAEAGYSLAHQAGERVAAVVRQVEGMHALINDISQASRDQASAVAQVGQVIAGLDETTQHNAALVEESAAAAESLQRQAAHLAQAAASFRLPAAV